MGIHVCPRRAAAAGNPRPETLVRVCGAHDQGRSTTIEQRRRGLGMAASGAQRIRSCFNAIAQPGQRNPDFAEIEGAVGTLRRPGAFANSCARSTLLPYILIMIVIMIRQPGRTRSAASTAV